MKLNFAQFGRSVGVPLVGFGAGWLAWSQLIEHKIVTTEHQKKLYTAQLKASMVLRGVLPESISTGVLQLPNKEYLEEMIKRLKSTESDSEVDKQVAFEDALRQCGVPEQLEWLGEHIMEEIPFFFIADVFNAFANIHFDLLSMPTTDQEGSTLQKSLDIYLRDDPQFESELLCKGVFEKLLTNVVPFDVSCRVLAVLAVANRKNAQTLANLCVAQDSNMTFEKFIAASLEKYKMMLKIRNKPTGEAGVSVTDVETAALQLIRAINDASVVPTSPFWKIWAPSPTGRFPVIKRTMKWSEEDQYKMCELLRTGRIKPVGSLAVEFADSALEYLKC